MPGRQPHWVFIQGVQGASIRWPSTVGGHRAVLSGGAAPLPAQEAAGPALPALTRTLIAGPAQLTLEEVVPVLVVGVFRARVTGGVLAAVTLGFDELAWGGGGDSAVNAELLQRAAPWPPGEPHAPATGAAFLPHGLQTAPASPRCPPEGPPSLTGGAARAAQPVPGLVILLLRVLAGPVLRGVREHLLEEREKESGVGSGQHGLPRLRLAPRTPAPSPPSPVPLGRRPGSRTGPG